MCSQRPQKHLIFQSKILGYNMETSRVHPSAHELDIVRSAHMEADPFSYSPVFFHDARHDFSARMQALF